MWTVIKLSVPAFSTALLLVTLAGAQEAGTMPATEAIIAKMVQRDSRREAELAGYSVTRHYVVVNRSRRAETLVEVRCGHDGVKQFTILSEQGAYAIRRLVIHRMLQEEADASRPDIRKTARITPANYSFRLTGKEIVDGRPAYVMEIKPRQDNKYLIDGKIWVDAEEYAIVKIEGRPARTPSFWTRSVHFVHTYQKVGQFWLAASTHSESDIRWYGTAEVTIDNSSYLMKAAADRPGELNRQAADPTIRGLQ